MREGGPLAAYTKKEGFFFTEVQTLVIMSQILSGIGYLHSLNMCHRDLTLNHVVLSTTDPVEAMNPVKIIDFRKSSFIGPRGYLADIVTTPEYCSPEMVKEHGSYNTKADMWSSGVIMYSCLCGEFPFQGLTTQETHKKVYNGNFSTSGKIWTGISKDSKELMRGLLKYCQVARFSAEQAQKCKVVQFKAPAKQWT